MASFEEIRKKISINRTIAWQDEESRRIHSTAVRAGMATPESIEKRSRITTESIADPIVKERLYRTQNIRNDIMRV